MNVCANVRQVLPLSFNYYAFFLKINLNLTIADQIGLVISTLIQTKKQDAGLANMENFSYYNPTRIVFGKDVVNQLGDETAKIGKNALLVIGKNSVKKSGLYARVISILNMSNIKHTTYEGVKSNPIYQHADDAVKLAKDFGADVVIAIGGGSVIDSAKAIAMGYYHDGSVWDFFNRKATPKQALPLINILTLAATGTEMNSSTVIQDTENGMKKGFSHPLLYPRISFLDPTLTYSVPADYTAYGVTDLMAHAMEVYFSKGENKLTSHYIADILKLAMEYGPKALQNPTDYEARAHILWLSTNALNGTLSVGRGSGDWGVHGFEHSLSVLYDIPHGAGLSIVYPAWLKHFKAVLLDRLAFLATEVFDADKTLSKNELSDLFIAKIEDFYTSINTPTRLQQYNVNSADKQLIIDNLLLNRVRGANHDMKEPDYSAMIDLMFS